MKNVAQILSSTGFPAILCVSADDKDLNIKAFVDTVDNRRITILSNLSAPFSPISGARMAKAPANSQMEVASSLSDLADRFPVVASCLSCDHDTLVASEVAIDLDGETISCSNCGNDIEIAYYGDLLEAGEDDDNDSADEPDADPDDEGDLADTAEGDDHGYDTPSKGDIVDAISEDDDNDAADEPDADPDDEGDLADTTEGDDHGYNTPSKGDIVDADTTGDSADSADSGDTTAEDDGDGADTEDEADKTEDDNADSADSGDTTAEDDGDGADTEDEADKAEDDGDGADAEDEADKAEDSGDGADSGDGETASFTLRGKVGDIKRTILETADKLQSKSLSASDVSVTLSVASMSNVDDDLRLVACDPEMSRIEVFKGSSHIGRLLKAEASATVRPLFNKPDNLHIALSVALSKAWDALASDDSPEGLTDYGFKASSVDVDIDKTSTEVLSEIVDSTEQRSMDEVEDRVAEAEESFVKSLTIAMAGINKGVLDGPNFLTEISATLERYGVARAPEVAKRLVEKVSEPFLSASLAHAATLREEGVEYTRGMSNTIERASYPSESSSVNPTEVATSAVMSRFTSNDENSKVVPIETAKAHSPDRFRNAFRHIGRRR